MCGRDQRPPLLYMAHPSKSGWGVDDGDAAFLLGGYDKCVVDEGVARAAKKAGSSSLSPLSESPPGGRGARGARSQGTEGGRGGRRSPVAVTDADARRLDRKGPPSSSDAPTSAAPALAAPEAGATWECNKCGLLNDPSKM